MRETKRLTAKLNGRTVGTLATASNHMIAFSYAAEWLDSGFSISPLSLPLQSGVFMPKRYETFDGLFGVFADSLPDGWGRLLADRMLRKKGIDIAGADSLFRLAIVGSSGAGAITYHPENSLMTQETGSTLDELARGCAMIMESRDSASLDELFRLGGSSGGARPKVNYRIDGEDWIVKFASRYDSDEIGVQEYEYSLCARTCGIRMSETRLIPSDICSGYFATKRFDRENGRRLHMISASALLETSHRLPNLDYNTLMKLTLKITNDFEETEQLYRLMCFNVFAHNRDDHSKNFSYLYDEKKGRWMLSPAYDLTYSESIGGEHATTVNGNGYNPQLADILAVAETAGIDRTKARHIAGEIEELVHTQLGKWLKKK